MTLREKRLIAIAAYNTDRELVDIDYIEDENTRHGCLVLHKGITRVYKEVRYGLLTLPERNVMGKLIGNTKSIIEGKDLWFEF